MIPRIVIAGTSSGVGKTTVTVALIRALRTRGARVAVFKCGPDYLDPTYHQRAADIPCHNLDGWMMGREAVVSTFVHASRHADIAVLEGVMGLFDGASPTSDEGSTAQIAKWLNAPVVLVCDASGMARSVAALARGFAAFDAELRLEGLVCNRIGSSGHLDLLRKATGGRPPVLGGFPKQPTLAFPERHLGLHTADRAAVADDIFVAWGQLADTWLDLDAIMSLAATAPSLSDVTETAPMAQKNRQCRIGLAFDEAFHFYYDDNLRRLESLGAELIRFSPLRDDRVPDIDGLYFGGGYPEAHADTLSHNTSMRDSVAAFAAAGGPIYAECGGLMYLASSLRTLDGRQHAMVGIVPGETHMRERIQALGYVEVETQSTTILGERGLRFRGHQFRYSDFRQGGEVERVYTLRRRRGGDVLHEGYRVGNTLASYVHVHFASNPLAARGFVRACVAYAGRR